MSAIQTTYTANFIMVSVQQIWKCVYLADCNGGGIFTSYYVMINICVNIDFKLVIGTTIRSKYLWDPRIIHIV
jgi:hypothetical protein